MNFLGLFAWWNPHEIGSIAQGNGHLIARRRLNDHLVGIRPEVSDDSHNTERRNGGIGSGCAGCLRDRSGDACEQTKCARDYARQPLHL